MSNPFQRMTHLFARDEHVEAVVDCLQAQVGAVRGQLKPFEVADPGHGGDAVQLAHGDGLVLHGAFGVRVGPELNKVLFVVRRAAVKRTKQCAPPSPIHRHHPALPFLPQLHSKLREPPLCLNLNLIATAVSSTSPLRPSG